MKYTAFSKSRSRETELGDLDLSHCLPEVYFQSGVSDSLPEVLAYSAGTYTQKARLIDQSGCAVCGFLE